jgi:hypothetical protein
VGWVLARAFVREPGVTGALAMTAAKVYLFAMGKVDVKNEKGERQTQRHPLPQSSQGARTWVANPRRQPFSRTSSLIEVMRRIQPACFTG